MATDPNQPQQNPLAGLMALMGPNTAAPAAPQQQAVPPQQAAVPSGGGGGMPPSAPPMGQPQQQSQQPQSSMSPMIQGLMGQAQQGMSNPMGQPVPPQGQGLAGLAQHPIVQALLKGLAQAAQGYGWTAMQPQERLERTQMQQNKADTLARLAETGAYQQGSLDIRQQGADTNKQKAATGEEKAQTAAAGEASLADYRNFEKQNAQDKLALATDANQWKQDMAAGRLKNAQELIDQKATQFDQKIALAQKQFGLNETKVALEGEGMQIKQGMLDLARTALSQRGTVEGAQAMSKIQQFKIEHPFMSQFVDMSDLDQLVGASGGAGLPGVTPTPAQAASTGMPQPSATPNVAAPTPQNKAAAKSGKPKGAWNPVKGIYE
jgi:hypothetical protein